MEQILLTLIGGMCLVWLAFASAQRIEVGAAVLLIITYIITPILFLNQPHAIFNIGGVTLYQDDLLVIILMLAVAFRFLFYKTIQNVLPLQRNLLVIFVVLFAFSTLFGVIKFGTLGFADARLYFGMIAALLYFLSFQYTDKRLANLAKMLIVASALISIIGFTKLAMWGGDFGNLVPDMAYWRIRGTIGIGPASMIIVIAWLILMAAKFHGLLNRNIIGNFLLMFFFLMLVLIQERTLWVITGIYLIYFLLQYNIRILPYVPFATLAIGILGVFLYNFNLLHIRQILFGLYTALITSQGPDSTLAYRFAGWILLLKNLPLENYFFGLPMGSGYERIQNGVLVTFSPHNFYVHHILRIGIIGMLAFLMSHIHVLIRSYRNKQYFFNDKFKVMVAEILALGIIANLVYSIAYDLSPVGGAFWGLAVAVTYATVESARFVQPKNPLLVGYDHKETELK